MTATTPKPIYVISDVNSDSFTTAIGVINSKSPSEESVLLCGTNDGSINLWSLRTYRCRSHIPSRQVAKLLGIDHQNDTLRMNSIFAISSTGCNFKILSQLKTNLLCLLDIDEKSCNNYREVAYKISNVWNSFSTTFSKCFRLLGNCFAFLTPTDSDVVQLVNIERNVRLCVLKLISLQENKIDHGVVMSLHLFLVDGTPMPFMQNENEKQAICLILAYEDGSVILYRASLDEKFSTIYDERKNSDRLYNALELSVCRTHPEMITCADFNDKVMRGISCSVDNEIALWSVNLPDQVFTDNKKSCASEEEARFKIAQALRDSKSGIFEHQGRRVKLTNAGILCCAIRPDGRIFATGGKDARIRLFALKSGKPLAIMPFHSNAIECVHFSMNLSSADDIKEDQTSKQKSTSVACKYLLFASSRDKLISIWSLYNNTA